MIIFIILLGCYLSVGVIVYSSTELHDDGSSWTSIDALFSTATMSTVGYGDLSPGSDTTKCFTILMIFFGIIVIFPRLAWVVCFFSDPITSRGRALLEWIFPQYEVDIDGSGEADYKIPRHPIVYYPKNMLPSVLLSIWLQLASAAVFTAVEDWSFFDAFYHCTVTATTVGYGDVTISTQEGRLWASLHMVLSVCIVGELISTIGELRDQRVAQIEKIKQLNRRLDPGLLHQLLGCAKRLRPEVEQDGLGLTELEFALTMIIELGIVKMEEVRPFIKQFRKIDVSNNGRVGIEDMQFMNKLSLEDLAKPRLANAQTRSIKIAYRVDDMVVIEPAAVFVVRPTPLDGSGIGFR